MCWVDESRGGLKWSLEGWESEWIRETHLVLEQHYGLIDSGAPPLSIVWFFSNHVHLGGGAVATRDLTITRMGISPVYRATGEPCKGIEDVHREDFCDSVIYTRFMFSFKLILSTDFPFSSKALSCYSSSLESQNCFGISFPLTAQIHPVTK